MRWRCRYKRFAEKYHLAVGNINQELLSNGIELLVEVHYHWKIVTNETQQLSNNLTASYIKLGWTLRGIGSSCVLNVF